MSNDKALTTIEPGAISPFEVANPEATEAEAQAAIQMVNEQDEGVAYGQPRVLAQIKDERVRYFLPGKSDEPLMKEDASDVLIIGAAIARTLRLVKEDKIPVCVSTDGGLTGTLLDGALERHPNLPIANRQACVSCPYNKWGTAVNDQGVVGRGKQCRERRNLLLLHPGFGVPVILGLSPTSIGAWDGYAQQFVIKRPKSSYIAHLTRIGARNERNDAGQVWSVATFAPVRKALPGEIVGAAELRTRYMELLVRYEDEEEAKVATGAGGGSEPPPPEDSPDIPFE